jgi:hypothetical protein
VELDWSEARISSLISAAYFGLIGNENQAYHSRLDLCGLSLGET